MNNKTTFLIGIIGVSLFVVSSVLGGILIENYNMASQFAKGTSVPGNYTEQITWMESVMALCNNEEYSNL